MDDLRIRYEGEEYLADFSPIVSLNRWPISYTVRGDGGPLYDMRLEVDVWDAEHSGSERIKCYFGNLDPIARSLPVLSCADHRSKRQAVKSVNTLQLEPPPEKEKVEKVDLGILHSGLDMKYDYDPNCVVNLGPWLPDDIRRIAEDSYRWCSDQYKFASKPDEELLTIAETGFEYQRQRARTTLASRFEDRAAIEAAKKRDLLAVIRDDWDNLPDADPPAYWKKS